MADFPEKDNYEQEEEFSTIFSDPTEHRKIKIKNKKLWPKIVAGVLALAVLVGGTVAVIRLIPVLEDENSSLEAAKTIEVKKLETSAISTVSVTNPQGTVELCSEMGDGETTVWYTKQVDKSLTSSTAVEEVVTAACNISATMKITQKTAEECGLAAPLVKATVTPKEGEGYTVLVGVESPDKSGYYLKLENEETIYLVSSSVYTALDFDILDLADISAIPGFVNDGSIAADYFSSGTLSKFERLVISSKSYESPTEITYNEGEEISEFHRYLVTSPQKRLAQNIDKIMSFYQSGVSVSGAYSYEVTDAAIKQFGLDDPDFITTMYAGGKSITYAFALQEDGDYAAIGDSSRLIHKVSSSTMGDIVKLKQEDFYLPTIFITNIDTLSNFTLTNGEKVYSFDIVKNEEGEDGTKPKEDYTVTIDGKKIKSDNFQTFYAQCIELSTEEFIIDNLTSKPEVSFILNLKDGGQSKIEFTKVNDTRYQCKLDGNPMGRVTSSDLNRILELVEKVAKGEDIS